MSEEEIANQNADGETHNAKSIDSAESQDVKSEAASINEQPLTINNEPITNMEVHHPHHVTHKKKWGEYLLEFFMLFLAVFLGFVSENIRETSVEHEHEKQYAKLLLFDLRTDSAYLAERNNLVESRLQKHKVFYDLMTDSSNPSDKQIINAFLPVFYTYDLKIAQVTYNQMKTSGSLRYIQNENLLSELQQYYDVMIPKINSLLDLHNQYYENVIYTFFLQHIRIQDIDDEADSVTAAKPVIINRTPQTNQEMLNIIQNYASDQIHLKNRNFTSLTAKNHELIHLIKKEYNL